MLHGVVGREAMSKNDKDCENGRISQHLLLSGCMIMIPANIH